MLCIIRPDKPVNRKTTAPAAVRQPAARIRLTGIWIVLACAVLVLTTSGTANAELVGLPSGQLSVDPTGAANYRIPISVPPGVAGVSPSLALLYNSRAGNGLLGMGWSLSGLSAVSRCPATIATDGFQDDVDLQGNDQYCLDGQRLIDAGGGVYGTEVESFQRVVRETGNGACSSSFRVQDKSGVVREYGGTADSCIEAGTTGAVLVWAVSRISDIFGNYIDFSYGQDTVNGEYWPEQIEYGSSAALVASVTFSYDTTRPDVSHAYVAGAKTSVNHRLTSVKTYSEGALVRSYNLDYRQGGKSGRSQLKTVSECDALGDCLPAITLNWQQGALGFAAASPGSLNTGLFHSQVLDMDGDGILDLAYFSNASGGGIRIYRGASPFTSSFASGISLTQAQAEALKVLDYNGDGRSDLAYPSNPNANSSWVILRSRGLDPVSIDPPSCPGGDPPGSCPVDTYFDTLNTAVPYKSGGNSFFVDVDADGRHDLLHSGMNSIELYLNGNTGIVTTPTDTASYPGLGFQRALNMDKVAVNLDSDGRSDILLYYCQEQIDRSCNSSDPHYFVKVSYKSNNNLIASDIDGILGNQILTKVRPVDINGDGLTDIMYRSNSVWRVHIHNGVRFLPAVSFNPGITVAQADRVQIIDYNGDGRSDLIYPKTVGGEVWQVALSNGSGWSEVISTSIGTANATLFVDLSGDGLTDLFFDANGGAQSWQLRRQQPMMHDLLARINKEHVDDETNIFYVPATDPNFYTRGDYVAAYPVHSFAGPLYLVSHFSADTGTLTDSGDPGRVFTSYHYANGLVDRQGRGFRGFHEVRALNSNTQTLTINTHKLEFPFNGMLETAEQRVVDGVTLDLSRADLPLSPTELVGPMFDICNEPDLGWTPPQCNDPLPDWPLPFKAPYVPAPDVHSGMLVSRTTNTLGQQPSLATGGVFPHIDMGEQELFDLATGSRYKRVQTDFSYDGWGNAGDVVVSTYNGIDGELHVLNTHNDFVNWTSGGQWCLARLTRSEVRQQRFTGYSPTGTGGNPAAANTNSDPRVSTFAYDTATCQIDSETNDPLSPFELTRTHSYDHFGNRTATTISGVGIEPRMTRTVYDSAGQFPVLVQNDLGHTETKVWDPRFGLQLSQTGPNNLTTTWQYDSLGRRVQETTPLSTLHRDWTLEWCDLSPSGCVSSFATHKLSVTSSDVSAAGGIQSITEFDKLGREVATRTLMLGGNYATTEMRYDPLGRMFAKSTPGYTGPACWIFSVFDNIGRIVQERRPASSAECAGQLPAWNDTDPFPGYSRITDYAYNGLAKTVTYPAIGTPAFRRQETRVHSPVDRLLKVCESASCSGGVITTQYDYDVYGNTTWVKDADGNVSTMYYNKLGHKTEMRDPDMGTWLYQYNVLGELILQEDAKGQILEQRFDTIGRMTYRNEPEGETTWIYDVAPGKGIGKIAYLSAPDGYGEGYAYDSYGRPSEIIRIIDGEGFLVSQTYDAFGRLDVLSYPDRDAGVVLPAVPGQPGTPQVPGGTNTSGNYTVTWGAASGSVVNYKLFESAPDGTFPTAQRIPEYVTNATSFPVMDRDSGLYKYKVQACNQGGCGSISQISAAVTVDRPLGQAHAPTVQANSTGAHTVRWDAYPGATHYKLYRSANPLSFTGSTIYAGADFSFEDALTTNGTFYYAVRACETSAIATCGVLSTASNAVAISLPVPAAPGAPTISPNPSNGSHTVSWSAVGGALTYQLYRSTTSGAFPGGPIAQTNGLSAPDNAGVGQYYYVLEACAGSDYGACSAKGAQSSVQVQPVAPNAPTFTDIVDASVTVTWNSVSGAGRYVLDRRLGSNTITVYDNAATSFDDEVTQTGTYDYQVKACGGTANTICGQYSPFSSVMLEPAVQGPPDPPLNVDGPNFVFTNTPYTIDWDPPQGTVDDYDVQEKRNSGPWNTVATRTQTFYNTSKSLAGQYDYQVRACIDGPPRLCSTYAEMPGTVSVEPRGRQTQVTPQTGDKILDRNPLVAGVSFVRAAYSAQGGAASASSFAVKHSYSATGHQNKVQRIDHNGVLGEVYWEALAMDALGNISQERLAGTNALSTTRTFDQASGYLEFLATGSAAQIQNHEYDWDALGNLESRRDLHTGNREDFTYDALYRLDTVIFTPAVGQAITTAHSYDDIGNLLSKGDISNYQYGANAGPHAVTSVLLPGGSRSYTYDDNGNMLTTSESGQPRRNISWSSFNKPTSIVNPASGDSSAFSYDADRSRYKQVAQVAGREETTVYVGSSYERKTIDADYAEHRHFVFANGRVVAEYTVSDDVAIDTDGDGVTDAQDNCINLPNPAQRDTDGDSFGNFCDGDFNNDGAINFLDLTYLKGVMFSNDPDGDMDGSGMVNFVDLGLFKEGVFGPPGPSGLVWADGRPRGERTRYWLRDHLGSVAVIADGTGNVLESLSYDAWGKRRPHLTWDNPGLGSILTALNTQRGYTGHEHLDHLGLINMNGRIYDPEIGRFLSADVFVQFPDSTQGLNRYTYVGNNPLSYSDPSGHFIFAIVAGLAFKGATLGVLVAAVGVGGFIDGYLASGGDLGAALRGGILSALSAGIANGIGGIEAFDSISFATNPGLFLAKATLHGLSQGGLSELGGGRFGDGFLGGFSGSVLEPITSNVRDVGGAGAAVVTAAVVGGTVSAVAGGKFANGAASAAFVEMFNNGQHGEESTTEESKTSIAVKMVIKDVYEASFDSASGYKDAIKVGKRFTLKVERDGSATLRVGSNVHKFDANQMMEGAGLKLGALTVSATVKNTESIQFSGKISLPKKLRILGDFSITINRTIDVHSALINNSGLLGEAARGVAWSELKRRRDRQIQCAENGDCEQ